MPEPGALLSGRRGRFTGTWWAAPASVGRSTPASPTEMFCTWRGPGWSIGWWTSPLPGLGQGQDCQLWPELPQPPHQAVQRVGGPQLGLTAQHSPHSPLSHVTLGGEELQQLCHSVGQLVPGQEGEEELLHEGQLLLVCHAVILETQEQLQCWENNTISGEGGVPQPPHG